MSLLFRQPQSAGELLDVSLNVVKRNPILLMRLGIWPLVTLTAIDLVSRLLPSDSSFDLLVLPLSFGIYSVAEARVSLAAWQLLHREPVDVATIRARVRRRLWSVVAGYTLKWLGIIFGLLLLVPGVLLTIRWFAVPIANLVENQGPVQSLRRSAVLARGNRRQIFATIGLLDFALILGSLIFAFSYMDLETGQAPLWTDAVNWLFALVYLPYHGVLSSALYGNARVRNEGYDVEQLSQFASGWQFT